MKAADATARAREAMLARMLPLATQRDEADLVVVAECAGGMCPRKGRAMVGALVRAGLLERLRPGVVVAGPRYPRWCGEEKIPCDVGGCG